MKLPVRMANSTFVNALDAAEDTAELADIAAAVAIIFAYILSYNSITMVSLESVAIYNTYTTTV